MLLQQGTVICNKRRVLHFAMHALRNHVEVLRNVTPIDLLVQSAILFSTAPFIHPIHGFPPVIYCVSIQYYLPFDSREPCGGAWRLRWYKYNTLGRACKLILLNIIATATMRADDTTLPPYLFQPLHRLMLR